MKELKTNVMRVLDQKSIIYNAHPYDHTLVNAVDVADCLGQNPSQLFKTLVTAGKSRQYYVFMIPGDRELDLKKAAQAAGEKSIELIPAKELLPLTGYIHGGCSPIGMKKQFRTFIDETAKGFDTIYFSAGRVGFQVELALGELWKAVDLTAADIIKT